MKTTTVLLSLLLIAYCTCLAAPADSIAQHKWVDSIFDLANKKVHATKTDSMVAVFTTLSSQDSIFRKAYINYQLWGLQHRNQTLQWNLTSGIIIFWCVILLVFTGIVFAGVQFYLSTKNKVAGAADIVTQIEAGMNGIKVSSPVLGVIILTLSLLFFYLYLVYVYPVSEVF